MIYLCTFIVNSNYVDSLLPYVFFYVSLDYDCNCIFDELLKLFQEATHNNNKTYAAIFSPFWNDIIKSLREEDYISNRLVVMGLRGWDFMLYFHVAIQNYFCRQHYIYVYVCVCVFIYIFCVQFQGDGLTFYAEQHWKSEISSMAAFSSKQ